LTINSQEYNSSQEDEDLELKKSIVKDQKKTQRSKQNTLATKAPLTPLA
jgi:hypothetical protein